MSELHLPWLELAILIPAVGAAPVARLKDTRAARHWCLGFTGAALLCTLGAWQDFAALHAEVAHDPGPFASSLRDFLEVDVLSAPLLPLTALLYLLTAI